MTPAETYYALNDYAENDKNQQKMQYEISRSIIVTIWNSAGRQLERLIEDEVTFMPFPWEKPKKQSVEDMKSILMGIATKHNKKFERQKNKK